MRCLKVLLENGDFQVYLQPKVWVENGSLGRGGGFGSLEPSPEGNDLSFRLHSPV